MYVHPYAIDANNVGTWVHRPILSTMVSNWWLRKKGDPSNLRRLAENWLKGAERWTVECLEEERKGRQAAATSTQLGLLRYTIRLLETPGTLCTVTMGAVYPLYLCCASFGRYGSTGTFIMYHSTKLGTLCTSIYLHTYIRIIDTMDISVHNACR